MIGTKKQLKSSIISPRKRPLLIEHVFTDDWTENLNWSLINYLPRKWVFAVFPNLLVMKSVKHKHTFQLFTETILLSLHLTACLEHWKFIWR